MDQTKLVITTTLILEKNHDIASMTHYQPDTIITFSGNNTGYTISEIVAVRPSAIEWYCTNLDHFYLSSEVILELQIINPNFKLSEDAVNCLAKKAEKIEKSESQNDEENDNSTDPRGTWEYYNGSYAQDVEGYDDFTIDEAYGGDPDMYWNTD